ncbi:MAG: type II toxin-antitoxin system RelE/ParE family toxin [Nitrospirae bacterium]|nr:type II toxin-antitoxin system RelE/ParE family toxin [Nitrospirota bacterium]
MAYELDVQPKAIKALAELDPSVAKRITDKLRWLSENITELTPLPLSGNLAGQYKLYIGVYRAVYSIDRDSKIVTVHNVGHRKNVYD